MRVLLGGVVGGLVVFAWGAVAHMVLRLGDDAMKNLPDEARIVSALESVDEPGFYFFPGMERDASEEEQEAWAKKYEAGPTAIIVYHPKGEKVLSPRKLGTEFGSNAAAALLAALVVAGSTRGFVGRTLTVAAMGLFAWLSISVSYWAWYRFPTALIRSEAIEQVAGWALGGLAIAAIVKGRSAR